MADKKGGAYSNPVNDTDFRKKYDLDEYAAKAKKREADEREERKARYEAKLAGKKYYKPATGDEKMSSARREALDVSDQVGKIQIVPAGAGVGRRGRGAGFYCEACDYRATDTKQLIEHRNTREHLINSGETDKLTRATKEEVVERILYHIEQRKEREAEKGTSLEDRLALREEENQKEVEEKRRKKKALAEQKRAVKEEAVKVKTEYGDDVRIEGEHEEEDMLAQLGFAGFGGSKKR